MASFIFHGFSDEGRHKDIILANSARVNTLRNLASFPLGSSLTQNGILLIVHLTEEGFGEPEIHLPESFRCKLTKQITLISLILKKLDASIITVIATSRVKRISVVRGVHNYVHVIPELCTCLDDLNK